MSEVADSDAGTGTPDPAAADTPAEFVDALRRLKRWSGLGYRQLEKRAAMIGESLPRSTLTAALARDTLPREDLLAAFVRTCGCDDGEVRRWVDSRRRIAATAHLDGVGPVFPTAVDVPEIVARDGSNVALLAKARAFIGKLNWPVRVLLATVIGGGVVIVLGAAIDTIRDLAGDRSSTSGVVNTWYGANKAWTNTAHTRGRRRRQ